MPAAAVRVSYVLRTQPKNMNHNAELSPEQQTTDYSYIGSRFLIIFLIIYYRSSRECVRYKLSNRIECFRKKYWNYEDIMVNVGRLIAWVVHL